MRIDLLKAIIEVSKCAAKDETHPQLCGVLVTASDTHKDICEVYATDGHKVVRRYIEDDGVYHALQSMTLKSWFIDKAGISIIKLAIKDAGKNCTILPVISAQDKTYGFNIPVQIAEHTYSASAFKSMGTLENFYLSKDYQGFSFGINAELLVELAESLKAKGGVIKMQFMEGEGCEIKAIKVTRNNGEENSLDMGIIMPCRIEGAKK